MYCILILKIVSVNRNRIEFEVRLRLLSEDES